VELRADRVCDGYLKRHYPAEFFLLNAWPMGFYSPATLIHEAKRSRSSYTVPCARIVGVHDGTDGRPHPARVENWLAFCTRNG
jgi:hypothetical protein